tara:strand:- start:648 stop:1181 length:534 start_codon:yes stop_codon:yes gene_type:complete
MNYRIYRVENFKLNLTELNDKKYLKTIDSKIKVFETEIINEYENKQLGRKGIKTLGNEIRYNEVLEREVFNDSSILNFRKVTGNRKDFLKDFILILREESVLPYFLIIYDTDFRKKTSIVDGTSTKYSDIVYDLKLISDTFTEYNFKKEIYIIEILDISNCYFKTDEEGYTRLIKVK